VISTAISELAVSIGWELYLLNRGNRSERVPAGTHVLTADIVDEATVTKLISNMNFDVVVDFIAFEPFQINRDLRLFSQKTSQFIFISSASAYQKPLSFYKITESTPLSNPYSEYARNKIACEERLMLEYRNTGFPVTIIRPSHTYDERSLPLSVQGKKGSWQVIDRIMKGKPVLIHGDGSSLWTLTYSDDFAKAFVGIMGNSSATGETIQITSDESLTWDHIYNCIGNALKTQVKKFHVTSDFLITCKPIWEGAFIGDKSSTVVFDNSKIKRLVPDFIATTRFDEGARICVEYILSHPELHLEDEEFDAFCDNIIKVQQEASASFKRL